MKYLIVGLGNIGKEYENTRHNIGFMVLDAIAQKNGLTFDTGRHAFVAEFKSKGRTFILVKPTTYMNLSGKAVNYWLKDQKITVANLMVIVDDVSLPFGKLRLRPQGSAAGHNGLRNIEEVLQSANYPRLKFGIGNDYPKGRQVDYVLGKFSAMEMAELEAPIDKCIQMIDAFAFQGIGKTMTLFND